MCIVYQQSYHRSRKGGGRGGPLAPPNVWIGGPGRPNMFHKNKCYNMHDFAGAFWEHNIYKIPQRNLCPSTVRIQMKLPHYGLGNDTR